MVWGPIAASLAGTAVKAGASYGLSKLFGGDKTDLSAARPLGFSAGGLHATFGEGGLSVSSDAGRKGIVGNLAATFPKKAAELAALRREVRPGFGRLTTSRLSGIGDTRRRVVGDLKENLQRRRVLGSSFAQDTIARAEREFSREADRIRTESFMQELGLSVDLVGKEFEARAGEFATLLSELNLQSEVALQLTAGAQAQVGANQRLQATLAADSLKGVGAFLEPDISGLSKAVSGGAASLFASRAGGA